MTLRARQIFVLIMLVAGCRNDRDARPYLNALRASVPRPDLYTSERFESRVLSAEDGKPVEGAVVVALWRAVSIRNGHWYATFRSEEVLTDSNGRFTIQRWGPRYLERDSFLDRRDPEIWILKRGFLLGYADNDGALDRRYFAADQRLPAGKLAPFQSILPIKTFSRAENQPVLWSGKDLVLHPARSDAERRRTLQAANPIVRPDLMTPRLPLYWKEWRALRSDLPANVAAEVEPPAPMVEELAQDKIEDEIRRSMPGN